MARVPDGFADIPNVKVIWQTPDAIRIQTPDGKIHWIPQSAVHDDSEVWKKGQTGTIIVAEWIAEKRGLL